MTSEAANAPVIIKKEPGVNTAAPAAVPPQAPPLPQLDQDPIADVRQEQARPSDVTDVAVDPEDTKPVGLASFLEDVIITKTEKATKTKLDQAKQEMDDMHELRYVKLEDRSSPLVERTQLEVSFVVCIGKSVSQCSCNKCAI